MVEQPWPQAGQKRRAWHSLEGIEKSRLGEPFLAQLEQKPRERRIGPAFRRMMSVLSRAENGPRSPPPIIAGYSSASASRVTLGRSVRSSRSGVTDIFPSAIACRSVPSAGDCRPRLKAIQ